MIICFYIEVADKAEQVKVEHAMAAPFIDAGKVSDLSLEEFELRRLGVSGVDVEGLAREIANEFAGCSSDPAAVPRVIGIVAPIIRKRIAQAAALSCKGCKSQSHDYFEHDGCIVAKTVDKEQGRWQQAIYEQCRKRAISPDDIDGGGCDSGDPLDLTLTEIGQTFCQLENPQDYRTPAPPEAEQEESDG